MICTTEGWLNFSSVNAKISTRKHTYSSPAKYEYKYIALHNTQSHANSLLDLNLRHPRSFQDHLRRDRLRCRSTSRRLHLGQLTGLRALHFVVNRPCDFDCFHAILGLYGFSLVRRWSGFDWVVNQVAIGAARFALPVCFEELAHLEAWEGVSFCI
jgi:hypothetical protein